jgi:hypothetical protein
MHSAYSYRSRTIKGNFPPTLKKKAQKQVGLDAPFSLKKKSFNSEFSLSNHMYWGWMFRGFL